MNLDRYNKLKKQVEELQSKVERSKGGLAQLNVQMKKEFGCNTKEEVDTLIKRLEKKVSKLNKECEVATREFNDQWGKLLEDEQ